MYKDAAGGVVLSNLPAGERPAERPPESLSVVKSHNWAEATLEEIAATEKENREAARIGALCDLATQAERLADEIQKLNDLAQVSLQRPTEINQVAVTQGVGFGRLRVGPRR
jgi:hypothetical protein